MGVFTLFWYEILSKWTGKERWKRREDDIYLNGSRREWKRMWAYKSLYAIQPTLHPSHMRTGSNWAIRTGSGLVLSQIAKSNRISLGSVWFRMSWLVQFGLIRLTLIMRQTIRINRINHSCIKSNFILEFSIIVKC